ncbi:hypothetical protein [uncultured Faecalibaculum sp.]|uniref:hypothetical protein n=1 Tax=uncultured Faecalibaculum sp. TaxID=1729681 RepID=UPI00263833EB|nr:hypothetical protein [uncultured Faecalibaculum sp.]
MSSCKTERGSGNGSGKANGFLLMESLLALLVLSLCATLILETARMVFMHGKEAVDETISTEWFHAD